MQYQGQILDGQMHGCGKLTYENGEYYDGDWVRGISYAVEVPLYLLFNIIMLDKFDFILKLHQLVNLLVMMIVMVVMQNMLCLL